MSDLQLLRDRRIVLGVCGGVAAYKSVELCRQLVGAGAFVQPVLTQSALRFVGAPTFDALASEPTRTTVFDAPEPSPHTDLGQRADLILVAPATANLLAAARAGLASDLLTTTLLATRAPLVVAPAMHTEMWEHPATLDNLRVLRERGVHVVGPAIGELAGGDVGVGRLAPVEEIVAACVAVLAGSADSSAERDLAGLHVLVSAGGTREPIDPVRYIANRSSGKQGHAIAAAALDRGARVTLVSTVDVPADTARRADAVVRVDTAQELHEAMLARSGAADVVVMAAAVADHRPAEVAPSKLKRRDGLPTIALEPTPVVLDALVARRRAGQTIVGFAAETDDVAAHARQKLASSGADLLVANDVSAAGAGFEHDTNAVSILSGSGSEPVQVTLRSKREIADSVLDAVVAERSTAVADQVLDVSVRPSYTS